MTKTLLPTLLLSSILMACSGGNNTVENSAIEKSSATTDQLTNEVEQSKALLLAKWQGPYQGVPAFDKVSLVGLSAAIEEGMKINLAEIEAIANNAESPTFENTIVAMEKTGYALDRVFTYYRIWSSNQSSPEFREIQAEMAPKLSAFFSKINQNQALFARVQAVYNSDEVKSLTP